MYSLEQLAHFDRCLFPDNFRDDLLRQGINHSDAMMVINFIKSARHKNDHVGIVRVFQEFITIDELTKAFDSIVAEFVATYYR